MASPGPERAAPPVAFPDFASPQIAALFSPPGRETAALMRELRRLVYAAAGETPGVGELAETLKWGEPSYAPKRPRIGSPVRLAARSGGEVAMYFICHTHLVARFREIYPHCFAFEGDRALIFWPGAALPGPELRHCIAMALTFHLRRRSGG